MSYLRRALIRVGVMQPEPEPPKPCLVFNPLSIYWDQSYGTPIDAIPNPKLVVFGLPKSGNVWLVSLLSDYFGWPGIDPILEVDKKGVGMCHWPFSEEMRWRSDIVRGLCLVRDLRDVVASFYRYSQTEYFRKARAEFHYHDVDSFYFEWFLSRMMEAYRWQEQSQQYAAMGIPVVRYERMRKAPELEFARLLRRWGVPVDEAKVAEVVAKNSIDDLRETGKKLDVAVPTSHFGKGEVGGYEKTLPPHIIDDINVRFADLLRRWGYQVPGPAR